MVPQTKTAFVALFLVGAAAAAIALPSAASAATLSLAPATGNYFVGRSFSVNVDVNSADQAMNAVQASITFPVDKLSVVRLTTTNSIINLWVQQPSFSNQDGEIDLQGVVINPGFEGSGGKILTITFQALQPGTAPISFSSGSVLANDGQGTEILSGMQGSTITLTPVATGPSSPPSELVITSNPPLTDGVWYNINNITFDWSAPSDADAVDYNISNNPSYQLPDVSQGLVSETTYNLSNFPDGKWYFFVNARSGGSWSTPAVKQLWLDHTPPDPFVIVREDTNFTDVQPVFQWAATDEMSGVADYQVKIGDGDWFDASSIENGSSSEYTLPPQSPAASRSLMVRAFDEAGNYRDASTMFQVEAVSSPCGASFIIINCAITQFLIQWSWLIFLIILIFVTVILLVWRHMVRKEIRGFRERLDRDLHAIEAELGTNNKKTLKKDLENLEKDVEREMHDLE